MKAVRAVDLKVPPGEATELDSLLARLGRVLDDAAHPPDADDNLVHLQVVISVGSPAGGEESGIPSHGLDVSDDATGEEHVPDAALTLPADRGSRPLTDLTLVARGESHPLRESDELDQLSQFVTEGLVRKPESVVRESLFTYRPAPEPAPAPPRPEVLIRRRRVRFGSFYGPPTPVSRSRSYHLRQALLPCAAVVLIFLQVGGQHRAAPKSATAPEALTASPAPAPSPDQRVQSMSATLPSQGRSAVKVPSSKPTATAKTSGSTLSPEPRPPKVVDEAVGSLMVESEPSGGQVFLNQEPVGVTPLLLPKVRARAYAIRIDADGFARWSRGIYVMTNKQTHVAARLDRDQR